MVNKMRGFLGLFMHVAIVTLKAWAADVSDNALLRGRTLSNGLMNELSSKLSEEGLVRFPTPDAWAQECVPIFEAEGFPESPIALFNHSLWQIIFAEHGLCGDYLACAYNECVWPYDPIDSFDRNNLHEDKMNLPSIVLHAKTAGDIVQAMQFANEANIGVAIKTSGHSFHGACTGKGLLVNLVNMTSYAVEEGPVECSNAAPEMSNVCDLAAANGKTAFLRVGGGEPFDQAYLAVRLWNDAAENENKQLHLVGGGSGTVGAAGGWLAGGGLAATTGMRMFGFGVDNVLQYDMVLPTGIHVRFGPSEWEQDEGFDYVRTAKVEGLCNANPLADESQWQWGQCDEYIDFEGLWHAVRGGGGGAYGVVTSVWYQLHEKPGVLQIVYQNLYPSDVQDHSACSSEEGTCESLKRTVRLLWINFLIDFFYNPSAIGVAEDTSNKCHIPVDLSLDFYDIGGRAFCYGDGGDAMVNAWRQELYRQKDALLGFGLDETSIRVLSDKIYTGDEQDYWSMSVEQIDENPYWQGRRLQATGLDDSFLSWGGPGSENAVPPGRMFDVPKPGVRPLYYNNYWNAILPLRWLVDRRDKSVPFLLSYAEQGQGKSQAYTIGGKSATAHDQMSSVNQLQREGSFMLPTLTQNRTDWLLDLMFGEDGAYAFQRFLFPGGTEYNHIGAAEMGPLKKDWTKHCPMSLSQQEKREQCVSLQEAVWGEKGVAKLRAIKEQLDPKSLLTCFKCILEEDDVQLTAEEGHAVEEEAATARNGVSWP